MFVLDYMEQLLDLVATALYRYVPNWYGIVLIYFLLYVLVHELTTRGAKVEKEKKRKIQQALQEVREEMGMKEPANIREFILDTPTEQEVVYQEKAQDIIRKEGGKPALLFFLPALSIFTLVSFFWYLKSLHTIPETIFLPYIVAILTFLTNFTKKKWWLNFLIALLIFWILQIFTGALTIFYLLVALYRFFPFLFRKMKKKKEKKKEGVG